MELMLSLKKKDSDNLKRENFNSGPSNLDCIEEDLWLGNLSAAKDVKILEKIKCSHILTIDSCPLPRNIISLPGMKTMFVQVTDMPKEDLLKYFESTYDFIKKGMESGVVLVHCYFGVSRSSTVVIAYLMKKYKLSADEAYKRLKEKRKFANPNAGFEAQLKLYERMNYTIDHNCVQYKFFRLKVASERVLKVKILSTEFLDVIKPDPSLATVTPEPVVYRCQKCRRILANESNVLHHSPGLKVSWRNPSLVDSSKSDICQKTLFIEPLAWMSYIIKTTEGKLNCPKCSSKLGTFNWTMGSQCPCGARMSPSFYLIPSKVERSTIVQNVQLKEDLILEKRRIMNYLISVIMQTPATQLYNDTLPAM